MKLFTNKIILSALAAALLTLSASNYAQAANADEWLPNAPAPDGQFGGAFVGSYDMRSFEGDNVGVRKMVCRMGWSPSALASFWVDGGVASLYLESGGYQIQGDYGTAAGVGASLSLPKVPWIGVALLGTAQGNMIISRLSHDRSLPDDELETRRSRFEWLYGSASVGLARQFGNTTWYGGVGIQMLQQKENRHFTSPTGEYKSDFQYNSGIKPGVSGSVIIPSHNRFHVSIGAEVYDGSQKITVSIGQWGTPGGGIE